MLLWVIALFEVKLTLSRKFWVTFRVTLGHFWGYLRSFWGYYWSKINIWGYYRSFGLLQIIRVKIFSLQSTLG